MHEPPPRHNHCPIDIGFAALSFRDSGSVQLAYRLLGFQDDWQRLDPGSARVAFYTNLPPGDLHFQVRGSNNAGVWSEAPAELLVRVEPRWYEITAVRILAVAGLLLLLFAALRINVRRMRRRERALSFGEEVRAQLRDFHRDHAAGLAVYPPCEDGDADTNWEIALGLADKGLYAGKAAGLVTATSSAGD